MGRLGAQLKTNQRDEEIVYSIRLTGQLNNLVKILGIGVQAVGSIYPF